jgi:hypothetical protein
MNARKAGPPIHKLIASWQLRRRDTLQNALNLERPELRTAKDIHVD